MNNKIMELDNIKSNIKNENMTLMNKIEKLEI